MPVRLLSVQYVVVLAEQLGDGVHHQAYRGWFAHVFVYQQIEDCTFSRYQFEFLQFRLLVTNRAGKYTWPGTIEDRIEQHDTVVAAHDGIAFSQFLAQPVLLDKADLLVVDTAESVTLQNTGKGALAGAVIGYNAGSGNSSSKNRRRAMIGGSIGAAVGKSGTTPGMEYTVKMDDGSTTIIISDQVNLKAGDCVSVEQVGDMTNIREQDAAACNPEVKEALTDLQDELVEDASECAQVKQELLDAKTTEAVKIATAKARILCN